MSERLKCSCGAIDFADEDPSLPYLTPTHSHSVDAPCFRLTRAAPALIRYCADCGGAWPWDKFHSCAASPPPARDTSRCVFCGHVNDYDCGMSDCRCGRCKEGKEGHALDGARAETERLLRRVAALESRLARVLGAPELDDRWDADQMRLVRRGRVWSRRRSVKESR
jgi:hypothetical protein